MARVEITMPKMGESIIEATIIKWHKKVGDRVELDEILLEIATDKVDSEIPSAYEGVISEVIYQEDDVVQVGDVIAILETSTAAKTTEITPVAEPSAVVDKEALTSIVKSNTTIEPKPIRSTSEKNFLSPLVKSIIQKEDIDPATLQQIEGSGKDGRITKSDILAILQQEPSKVDDVTTSPVEKVAPIQPNTSSKQPTSPPKTATVGSISGGDEIIEMDRMRRLIADHMVMSKRTSAHVTSFIETDVTPIVLWREKVKKSFEQQYGEKLTYTPIFIHAVARAIVDFPLINVSVDGYQIIRKKGIHIGMATALPNGNLIVPVIKNADQLNLLGLTRIVNDLAGRARINQLKPDEVQGGSFTLTNVGTFGNTMGTPIINQPQVAIMSVGVIKKKPAVIETPAGDSIGIRQMMFISLSYDHRVVDGMLGGSFLRRVADYLENFDGDKAF